MILSSELLVTAYAGLQLSQPRPYQLSFSIEKKGIRILKHDIDKNVFSLQKEGGVLLTKFAELYRKIKRHGRVCRLCVTPHINPPVWNVLTLIWAPFSVHYARSIEDALAN